MSDPYFNKFREPTDAEFKALTKLNRILTLFRTMDHKMVSAYIQTYVTVALYPSRGATESAKPLNTHQSMTSRAFLEIGNRSRDSDPGYQLVNSETSSENLSRQTVFLTHKGRR